MLSKPWFSLEFGANSAVVLNHYHQLLRENLESRRLKNPSYSLRAFARDLGVPVSNLSLILAGRKGMTDATARQIAKRLGLTSKEQERFRLLVEASHARSKSIRESARKKLLKEKPILSNVSVDMMKIVGEWHYFAILELLRISAFDQTSTSIASSLKIPEEIVNPALDRLERLELIEVKRGRYHVVNEMNWSSDGIPSEVIRNAHDAILSKASHALFTQDIDQRDFTSMMMTIDPVDLPSAKLFIRNFIKQFSQTFSAKPSAQKVYSLGIQLFDISPGLGGLYDQKK